MQDPEIVTPADTLRRRRAWLGWTVVAVAALVIAASFALSSDDAVSQPKTGPSVAPVTVAAVTRGSMTERSRYPGELDADSADIAAFYAGRLLAVHVRVGDAVKQGDVLAELDPVDAKEQIAEARAQARAAAAEEQRAKVEHAAAAAETARMEELARKQIISELEIDNLRARAAALAAAAQAAAAGEGEANARVRLLEKRLVESKVRAPFAGRVAARYVDPGATVTAGARLVRLVATEPLWVRFQVPEQDIIGLEPGTRLRVLTDAGRSPLETPGAAEQADPAIGVTAEVTGVASEVDRQQRVVSVEARLESPPAFWLPGMFAQVVVERRTHEQATIVPGVAVLSRLRPSGATERGVFVARDGVAKWVPVHVLARDGDRVAVTSSLEAGARVVVAGHVDLTDGNPVQLAGAEAVAPEATR